MSKYVLKLDKVINVLIIFYQFLKNVNLHI